MTLAPDEDIFRPPKEEEISQQQTTPKQLTTGKRQVGCGVDVAQQSDRHGRSFERGIGKAPNST